MGLPAARILQAFYCKREKILVSDYYQLLGVDRKATDKEIKRAYHRRLRKIHPDYAGPGHEEEVKQVNKAYEVLSLTQKNARCTIWAEKTRLADEVRPLALATLGLSLPLSVPCLGAHLVAAGRVHAKAPAVTAYCQ